MPTFVILRSSVGAQRREGKEQRVHGHLVDPQIGEFGGFVLDTIRVNTHPSWKDSAGEWHPRRVLKEETVWEPEECGACGSPLDPTLEGERPKLRRCPRCYTPIRWEGHVFFTCEPVLVDAIRLSSCQPDWTHQLIRSDAELAFYTHGEVEDAQEEYASKESEEAENTADAIEARAVAAATKKRSKVPQHYRDLQKKIDELAAAGAPADELPYGKNSKMAVMEEWIATYEPRYGTKASAEA